MDTLSKGKAIPYGRTKGILFRERNRKNYSTQYFPDKFSEYINIKYIKNIFQFVS